MAELFGQLKSNTKPMYIAGVEAVGEYTDGQRVRRKAPNIRLLINPFFPPFVPIEIVSADYGGLIQDAVMEKSRNMSHGTWQITFAGDDSAADSMTGWPLNILWRAMGHSLRDVFKPMMLAQLWIDGYHVMTGYLRTFRKQTSTQGKFYTAQFDELGAIYQQTILKDFFIGFGEELFIANNPGKALSVGGSQHGFFPLQTAISTYVTAFLASTLNYGLKGFPTPYLSGSDALPLAFRMIAQGAPFGGISNSSLLAQIVTDSSIFSHAGTSFWDFLKSLSPEPFMEIFTESGGRTICTGRLTRAPGEVTAFLPGLANPITTAGINLTPMLPGFNYLIMRTCPYDNPLIGISPWHPILFPYTMGVMDLLLAGDFIIITDDDVISKDLGVSDAQQYTVFDVSMNGKNASGGSGSGSMNRPSIASGPGLPIFPGGIRTYGPRLLETAIDSTSLDFGGTVFQSVQRFSRKFSSGANIHAVSTLLNEWFRNAAKFNEGTITTRAIPYARPGMLMLYLPSLNSLRVDDPRDIGTYYIDNITYNYTIGKEDTTSFSVIRGTPLPMSAANLVHLLLDWELMPPGLNVFDGEL